MLLLALAGLAGCASAEEPRVQRVACCHGPSSDNPQGDPVEVQFRQGSEVVHRAWVDVGTAFTAEVPVGAVGIYVDDVRMGAVDESVDPDASYRSPGPDDVTYIAGSAEGCPEEALLPVPGDS